MSLGTRLRKARLDAGMTLQAVGEALGKSPQAVSGWERDLYEPSADDLNLIARLTNVRLEWLISGQISYEPSDHSGLIWRGRIVPSLKWTDIASYLSGAMQPDVSARSHFPCGERSFQTVAYDRSNEPEIMAGDGIIIDPDLTPTPGDMLLVKIDSNVILRRYRPRAAHVELAPCNPDWPTITVPTLGDGVLIGVVSETSRPRRI